MYPKKLIWLTYNKIFVLTQLYMYYFWNFRIVVQCMIVDMKCRLKEIYEKLDAMFMMFICAN